MVYVVEELKKLYQEKIFIIFLLACFLVNIGIALMPQNVRQEVNSNSTSELTGTKIYDSLSAEQIGKFYYNEKYVSSTLLNRWMKEKYDKLQPAIEVLDSENADLSYYAGESTPLVHEALFSTQFRILIIECFIFIAMVVIKSYSIEYQEKMVSMVYTSKRGRKAVIDKMVATGVFGLGGSLLLIISSLLMFFQLWDFSKIWDENVASSFNYSIFVDEIIYKKPFITWASFTVKEYFSMSVLLMIAILIAWWLLSIIASLSINQIFLTSSILAGCIILPYFGMIIFPQLGLARLFYLDTMTLSVITINSGRWFTDLGDYALFPYQEIWSVIIHLLLYVVAILIATEIFKRKDVL